MVDAQEPKEIIPEPALEIFSWIIGCMGQVKSIGKQITEASSWKAEIGGTMELIIVALDQWNCLNDTQQRRIVA